MEMHQHDDEHLIYIRYSRVIIPHAPSSHRKRASDVESGIRMKNRLTNDKVCYESNPAVRVILHARTIRHMMISTQLIPKKRNIECKLHRQSSLFGWHIHEQKSHLFVSPDYRVVRLFTLFLGCLTVCARLWKGISNDIYFCF